MLIGETQPGIQSSFMNDGVWIQNEDILAPSQPDSSVIAFRKPQICAIFANTHSRKALANGVPRAIGRAVIGDNDLEFDAAGGCKNRAQTLQDDGAIVPANDDNREFHIWRRSQRPQLQRDDSALLSQRAVGGFEHSHDAQTGHTVVEGPLIAANALHKVGGLKLQSFDLFDIGRPHVAGAVFDELLVHGLSSAHLNAAIVDFQLFVRLEVVPDEHFLFAAQEGRAHFYGREPIHADVADEIVRIIDRQIGDIGVAVEVAFAGGDESLRLLADDVVHYREIVWREVPDHIHVVLKQAEIDPRGVVVVEVAESSLIDELTYALNSPGEEERVIHHDFQILAFRKFDKIFALLDRAGERLFDENVLSVLERGLGDLEVGPDGCDNSNRVYRIVGEHGAVVCGRRNGGMVPAEPLERTHTLVANADDSRRFLAEEIADDVRPPVAVTHDADSHDVGLANDKRLIGKGRRGCGSLTEWHLFHLVFMELAAAIKRRRHRNTRREESASVFSGPEQDSSLWHSGGRGAPFRQTWCGSAHAPARIP